MVSIFTRIIQGEIPCHKIAESEHFLAFLDVSPLREGHTLVVPKHEVDYIFDIEDDKLGEMMIFAKSVAKKVQAAIPCVRIGVAVIGLEVPHAHIHLIPMDTVKDINFTQKKMTPSQEELAATAAKICDRL